MRCLVLAEELRNRACQILFVSRDLPEYLIDLITNKDFTFINLRQTKESNNILNVSEINYSQGFQTSQEQDAADTLEAIANFNPDFLIVDHYSLDCTWEKILRAQVSKIIVIDDLADRQHDCDILLDQNFYLDMETRYKGKVPENCNLLLGPRYALLRKEFRDLRKYVGKKSGKVKNILISFGGIDSKNYTYHAIQALAENKNSIQANVVIGCEHPNLEKIKSLCNECGFILHVQTQNLAKLILDADLAIGAGGISIWERCCLGLPTISICTAENQSKQIIDASELGILYAPTIESNLVDEIKFHTDVFLKNPSLLKSISSQSLKITDGKGSLRVANWMQLSQIEIKRATQVDAENIFIWRNDKSIRYSSKNSQLIKFDDHRKWFDSILADVNCELIIAYLNNNPLGVCRFDVSNSIAKISIYLVPSSGFSGQGQNLLFSAERWIKNNRLDVKEIHAQVLGSNEASRKLFLDSNYLIDNIYYKKVLRD